MNRRDFLTAAGLGAGAIAAGGPLVHTAAKAVAGQAKNTAGQAKSPRPNIVWISAEDVSPDFGCYGDTYATTPTLDKFAAESVRYDRAFAHAPVCAPARSGIITGMYPTTIGTTWMRCGGVPPVEARCFPEYLRAAGYFCTNGGKTDYQFGAPASAWDSNSGRWKQRRHKDQPFFDVINLGVTHESSTRRFKAGQKFQHDPDKAPLPPYYPDTPVVRQNMACYYDRIGQLDGQVKAILDDLAADGLADNTIVWFWGDHGRGLTRGKRWIYDSGTRVPLMVRVPKALRKWAGAGDEAVVAPGRVEGDFATFIDFAPTVLSLAGAPIPKHMQGRAFLGPQKSEAPQYIFGARDRMDETYDCIRCVRDKRFKYIRNFMPYLTRAQHINYMDQTPILKEMRRLHAAGKLKAGPQMQFFEPTKPVGELYDITVDPHEVNNLADDLKYAGDVKRMNAALVAFMKKIGDVGLIPESDFDAMKGGGVAARPGASASKPAAKGAPVKVTLSCLTPGASMTYRIADAGAKGPKGRKGRKDPAGGGTFLRARDAKVHGGGARKSGDAVISWRGKDTWISWEVDIEHAGRIGVHILQANQGPGGSVFELAVGERKLEGTIRHTSTWSDYVYVKVGEVDIAKAGKQTVSIRVTKQVDGRLGNVAGVVLGGKDLPAGATIPSGGKGAPSRRKGSKGGGLPTLLYSTPIELKPGQSVTGQAYRLGYKPSKSVTYAYGGEAVAPEKPAETGPLWREKLNRSDLLDRLLALKAFDGRWVRGVDAYLKALKSADAPMRYWAVAGLHQAAKAGADAVKVAAAVAPHATDPAPSVRAAAGECLAETGRFDKGLTTLIDTLKTGGDKGSLLAACALERLGERVTPAADRIRAAGSGGSYTARALSRLMRKLK